MELLEPNRPWNRRRLAVTAILFASVAVNVVLLTIYFSRPDRLDRAGTAATPTLAPEPAASTPGGPAQAAERGAQLQDRRVASAVEGTTGRERARPTPDIPLRETRPQEARGAFPTGSVPSAQLAAPPELVAPGGGQPEPSRAAAPYSTPRPGAQAIGSRALEETRSAPVAARSEAVPVPEILDREDDEAIDEPDEPDEAGSDRSPPTLRSLRFDPPEIADGETTNLLLDISDDLSGVKSVSGNIRSPSGAAMLPFQAQGENSGGAFLAHIRVPPKAETGVWYLAYLSVLDQADNPLVASFTPQSVPPGGALRVQSAESDSTPPEVRRVSVTKRSVNGGEPNVVITDIEDDRSGVASIMGAFQSASRAGLIRFVGRATGDPAVWEGDLSVPASAECGEWTAQFVRAVDNAGNITYLSGDAQPLAGIGFNVSGSSCDAIPPTLESITLSPTTVSNAAAAQIEVTAMVRDDGSGAASMLGWVNGPAATNGQIPRIFFSCTRSRPDADSPWVGRIQVGANAAAGIWKLGLVRLQDKALNSRDYGPDDPIVREAVFEVR